MTEDALLTEVRALREFVAVAFDRHLSRHELADRLGISPATLDRRVKARQVPQPIHGKWPLSVIVEWEIEQKRKVA